MTRLAAVLALLCGPAWAECVPRDAMAEFLSQKHGEALQSSGLSGQVILELWADESDGSFTVVGVGANGLACIYASGSHWRRNREPKGQEG